MFFGKKRNTKNTSKSSCSDLPAKKNINVLVALCENPVGEILACLVFMCRPSVALAFQNK